MERSIFKSMIKLYISLNNCNSYVLSLYCEAGEKVKLLESFSRLTSLKEVAIYRIKALCFQMV